MLIVTIVYLQNQEQFVTRHSGLSMVVAEIILHILFFAFKPKVFKAKVDEKSLQGRFSSFDLHFDTDRWWLWPIFGVAHLAIVVAYLILDPDFHYFRIYIPFDVFLTACMFAYYGAIFFTYKRNPVLSEFRSNTSVSPALEM